MTIQLSDAQLAILTPALQREDRCIYPITASLKGGAVGNVAKSLIKRGLLEEVDAADNTTVWRCGEDGQPLTLCITDAGAAAVRGEIVDAGQGDQGIVEASIQAEAVTRKRGAAQEALVALLERAQGATVADMQEATDWQPHSVRGALSGVVSKKLGHTVTSTKEEGRGRVYRIV